MTDDMFFFEKKKGIPTYQQVEGDVGATRSFHDAVIAVPD